MKKFFVSTLALASMILMNGTAQAQTPPPTGPAWGCTMKVHLEGWEVGIFVAVKHFEGDGMMECKSVTGDVLRSFPIHMEINGAGLGFGLSIPENLEFLAGDIGVSDPRAIYGKYSGGISADGTLIDVGGTVGVGVAFSKRGASIRGIVAGGEAQGILGAITGSVVEISPR